MRKPGIRPARPDDIPQLDDIAIRAKAYWGHDEVFMAAARPHLKTDLGEIEKGWCFVGERNGRPIGFYSFHLDGETPELTRLFVEPDVIGTGVGRTLWRHAVAFCRGQNVERFKLESDPDAAPFYLKMGCCVTDAKESEVIPGRYLPVMEFDLRDGATTVQIRSADIDERAELIELQRRASLANPGDRDALQANPDAIDLPADQIAAGNVLVAEANGTKAGFSAIYLRDDGDAELDGLFVEPEQWKEGLGRRLVEAAASRASKHGAQRLHVIGNPHAEGFYKKVGFTLTGEYRTQFGRGLLMELPLRNLKNEA